MTLARTAAPPLTTSGKERIFQEAAMSHNSERITAGTARRSRSSDSRNRFGRFAERLVRAFGMPWFLATQTAVIVAWVVTNSLAVLPHFDPYPFIFMNLVFSALAAYAAPFIHLAETRQADRDRARARAEERHHDELCQATDESRRFSIRWRLRAGPHAGGDRRTGRKSMRPRDGDRLIVRRPDFETNTTENRRPRAVGWPRHSATGATHPRSRGHERSVSSGTRCV
jgi:uncharacterized membrane protein